MCVCVARACVAKYLLEPSVPHAFACAVLCVRAHVCVCAYLCVCIGKRKGGQYKKKGESDIALKSRAYIYSSALICTHLHSSALICAHLHSSALICTHLHSFALICTHLRSFALICTHLHSFALTCTHLHSSAHSDGKTHILMVRCGVHVYPYLRGTFGDMIIVCSELPVAVGHTHSNTLQRYNHS